MKNFDYNRFLQTLKWNIVTEKKTMLTHTLAFIVGFLVIQALYILIVNMFQNPGPKSVMIGMTMSIAMVFVLTYYYASGLLGNARTKEQRTTMLMLPAGNAEKFCARLVYVLLFIPLLVIAALLVATLLRMGIQLLLGHDYVVFGLGMLTEDTPFHFFNSLLAQLFSLSLFVLGGVLFRKHPFIWTSVSTMTAIFAITLIAGFIAKFVLPDHTHLHISLDVPRTVGNIVMAVLTVFNIWLSYRLFCRLQLVQHKWFNV